MKDFIDTLTDNQVTHMREIVKEAVELYDSIGKSVYSENILHFHEVGNRLFFFASSFYPIDEFSNYYTIFEFAIIKC